MKSRAAVDDVLGGQPTRPKAAASMVGTAEGGEETNAKEKKEATAEMSCADLHAASLRVALAR